jgi:hypothetical protein
MSDPEPEVGEGEAEQTYGDGYEPAGKLHFRGQPMHSAEEMAVPTDLAMSVGPEVASPAQGDHGLDSISGVDPHTQHAEEGSNTTHPSEQPDVISSYTGREEIAQTSGYGDEVRIRFR